MNHHIFREYDIRGLVGTDLTEETVLVLAEQLEPIFDKTRCKELAWVMMPVKAR